MSYVPGTVKWGGDVGTAATEEVTWSADYFDALDVVDGTSEQEFDAALQRAFDDWESVAAIDFVLDNSGAETDITVGTNGYEFPIAGLARISSSGDTINDVDVFFSTNIEWAPFGGNNGGDFFAVALHEIGHAIGMEHVPDQGEIMNATIFATELGNGDIAGAQYLYGPADDADMADAEQVEPELESDSFRSGGGVGGGGGAIAALLGLLALLFGLGPIGAVAAAGTLPFQDDDADDALADAEDSPLLSELLQVTTDHVAYTGDLAGHTGLPGCGCNACYQQALEDDDNSFCL